MAAEDAASAELGRSVGGISVQDAIRAAQRYEKSIMSKGNAVEREQLDRLTGHIQQNADIQRGAEHDDYYDDEEFFEDHYRGKDSEGNTMFANGEAYAKELHEENLKKQQKKFAEKKDLYIKAKNEHIVARINSKAPLSAWDHNDPVPLFLPHPYQKNWSCLNYKLSLCLMYDVARKFDPRSMPHPVTWNPSLIAEFVRYKSDLPPACDYPSNVRSMVYHICNHDDKQPKGARWYLRTLIPIIEHLSEHGKPGGMYDILSLYHTLKARELSHSVRKLGGYSNRNGSRSTTDGAPIVNITNMKQKVRRLKRPRVQPPSITA